ncbi:MAG: hypothetical protein CMI16_07075 [Opitutaceae bacterium]|nr:hypothetical protein [Opitutaceae bacterium]|tara:strand:- start:2192 stop:2914 length:723 start_codon:yes stop_codon:yes gene_type:complete
MPKDAWKLRDEHGPYKKDSFPPDSLLKLEKDVCPIVPHDDLRSQLTKHDKTISDRMSILPVASFPCATPVLLMGMSGCAWHPFVPSVHLLKLYWASLSVLHNTEGYERSEEENEYRAMEKRLFDEFRQNHAATLDEESALAAQCDFTFHSILLLEYQLLLALGVTDKEKLPNLISKRPELTKQPLDDAAERVVGQKCREECDRGTEFLHNKRSECTKNTRTALAYNRFLCQSNSSKVDSC